MMAYDLYLAPYCSFGEIIRQLALVKSMKQVGTVSPSYLAA